MNLRSFTIALLISALPTLTFADRTISFSKEDFVSAKQIQKDGDTVVSFKLSKSGKAKMKKLNQQSVGKEVKTEIAGVNSTFKLNEPIKGEGLEMGPYTNEDAKKVTAEINDQKDQ